MRIILALAVFLFHVNLAFAAAFFTENFGTGADWTTSLPAGWTASDDATSGMDDQLSITGGSDSNRYAWLIGDTGDQDITRSGISTAGFQNIKINYSYNLIGLSSGDFLVVEWKKSSDVSYTLIQKVTGVSGWNSVTFDLPASAANTNIDIRFRADETEDDDYVLIDNIQITGGLIDDCGDGNLDNGEHCDDGNDIDNDGCTNACTLTFCGDGDLQQPNGQGTGGPQNDGIEGCDDGNLVNDDSCDNNCDSTIEGPCGNSIINTGEQCDDGDTESGDGCSSTCQLEVINCGNNIIDIGEDCELPSTFDNTFCSQSTQTCQGTKQGTRDALGDCDSGCDCVQDPFTFQCEPPQCGAQCDADIDCNDFDPNTIDTCNLNSCGCENIETGECGNDIIDPPSEECDGFNIDEQSCLTLGFDGGSLSCVNCNFDTSSCFKCGDGNEDPGEQCDDGNTFPNDACTDTCQDAICGDGIIRDGFEECDDGNNVDGDGCDATCQVEEKVCTQPIDVMLVIDRSGSMILPPDPLRLQNAKSAAITFVNTMDFSKDAVGLASFNESAKLNLGLTSNQATIVNAINALKAGGQTNIGGGLKVAREEIILSGDAKALILLSDGAPNVNATGGFCFGGFSLNNSCANHSLNESIVTKLAGIEIFTIGLGIDNSTSLGNITEILLKQIASTPSNYFTAPNSTQLEAIYLQIAQEICPCGNGVTDPGEECDDGNDFDYDACTNDCKDAECGDNIVQIGVEQCDDGKNGVNTDQCTNSCTLTFCPDGTKQTPNGVGLGGLLNDGNEQCDDGNLIFFDGCLNNCVNNICGDGYVNIGVEECDDGNKIDGDGCDSDCQTEAVCGNGIVEGNEQCDDGKNGNNFDQCTDDCTFTFCGDGFKQTPNGQGTGGLLNDGNEQCDDGNNNNNDACKNDCTNNICGDGFVFPTFEQCEFPSTFNNPFCSQSLTTCLGTKQGTRDGFGDCDAFCDCVPDPFTFQCIKGQCGAECDSNDDCDDHNSNTIDTCNLDSCGCQHIFPDQIKKDSKASQAMPISNFGLGRYMIVNPKQGAIDRSYVRVDASQISSPIVNAILNLTVYQTGGNASGSAIQAWYCRSHDFVETTINWNNQPLDGLCSLADSFVVPSEVIAGIPETQHLFNLTNETNFELNIINGEDGLFTIVLRSALESTGINHNKKHVQYLTKDYPEAAFRPKFEVS